MSHISNHFFSFSCFFTVVDFFVFVCVVQEATIIFPPQTLDDDLDTLLADVGSTELLGGFSSGSNTGALSEEKHDVSNNNNSNNNSKYEVRFIVSPCPVQKVTKSFELNQSQMFPLYPLKSKIASFKKEILKHNTSDEYNLSNVESYVISITTDIQLTLVKLKPLREKQKELKLSIEKERSMAEQNDGDNMDSFKKATQNIQTRESELDQLKNEELTLNSLLDEKYKLCDYIWNETKVLILNEIDPLYLKLKENIDIMTNNNTHWKIIGNTRDALSFVKIYRKSLMNFRASVREIYIQKAESKFGENGSNEIKYPTIGGGNAQNNNGNKGIIIENRCYVCQDRLANRLYCKQCKKHALCVVCDETYLEPKGLTTCPGCRTPFPKWAE